jgi:hypothetical protein
MENSMDYYKNSLNALHYLFDKTGILFWRDKIESHIIEWEYDGTTKNHLNCYGGMGTLNDIIICPENKHNITKNQQTWVNTLFDDLKILCLVTARNNNSITPILIQKSLRQTPKKIQGWRCLNCGFSLLRMSDIEYYLAPTLLSEPVIRALFNETLIELIGNVLRVNIERKDEEISKIISIAQNSEISFNDISSWMRPCPNCQSNDTAVYRWVINSSAEERIFVPAEDNLPLRN